jgi:hypothetical protein
MMVQRFNVPILSFICSQLKVDHGAAPAIFYPWFSGFNDFGHWTAWLFFFGTKELIYFDSLPASRESDSNQEPPNISDNPKLFMFIQRLWIQWFIWDYQLTANLVPLTPGKIMEEWNIQSNNGTESPFQVTYDYIQVKNSSNHRICLHQGNTLHCGYFVAMTAAWLEDCFRSNAVDHSGVGPINNYQALQLYMELNPNTIPTLDKQGRPVKDGPFDVMKMFNSLNHNVIEHYHLNSPGAVSSYAQFMKEASGAHLDSFLLKDWLSRVRDLTVQYNLVSD